MNEALFNNCINSIVHLCRDNIDIMQIDLQFAALLTFYDQLQNNPIELIKGLIEFRFNAGRNPALPNMGYNADSVLYVKESFYRNFRLQLNLVLPSDHIGSVMEILQNLHVRLENLEQLRGS